MTKSQLGLLWDPRAEGPWRKGNETPEKPSVLGAIEWFP